VLLDDGTLLCGSSSEDAGWRVHMEWSKPPFTEWQRSSALNSADQWGAIQPTLLLWDGGRRIQSLVRTRQKVIAEHWSTDAGRTWTPLAKTSLPNPNSGIDAVRLRDGRALLVYNPLAENRSVISLAISSDGHSWTRVADLENTQEPGKADLAYNPGELSYPAVVQARDGKVHITYTWKREKIRHAIVDPARIKN
jgi:predicted neuraminidase